MKRYILTFLVIVIAHTAFAQFATTFIDETELQFKVKQIDEFMQRFNYDITYDGKKPTAQKDSIKYKENRVKICLPYSTLTNTWIKTRNLRNSQPI